jgi:hypothetical protein
MNKKTIVNKIVPYFRDLQDKLDTVDLDNLQSSLMAEGYKRDNIEISLSDSHASPSSLVAKSAAAIQLIDYWQQNPIKVMFWGGAAYTMLGGKDPLRDLDVMVIVPPEIFSELASLSSTDHYSGTEIGLDFSLQKKVRGFDMDFNSILYNKMESIHRSLIEIDNMERIVDWHSTLSEHNPLFIGSTPIYQDKKVELYVPSVTVLIEDLTRMYNESEDYCLFSPTYTRVKYWRRANEIGKQIPGYVPLPEVICPES